MGDGRRERVTREPSVPTTFSPPTPPLCLSVTSCPSPPAPVTRFPRSLGAKGRVGDGWEDGWEEGRRRNRVDPTRLRHEQEKSGGGMELELDGDNIGEIGDKTT